MGSNNIAAVLFSLAIALPLQASIAPAIPFDDKVKNADAIVLGECVSTRAEWDPTGRWILTRSTFRVDKALKGAAVPEVTVVTPGGQIGSIRQETVGVPQFESGSENVLFVKNGAIGPTVLYLEQGAYRVADENGEKTVQPAMAGLVLIDSQTGRATAGETARPLRDFERAVRESVNRGGRGPQRYDVAPPSKRKPARSPAAELAEIAKQYRFVIGLVVVAIALSSYLFIRGR